MNVQDLSVLKVCFFDLHINLDAACQLMGFLEISSFFTAVLVVVAIVDIVDTELVDLVLIDLVLIVSSFCLETFPDFSGPFLDFSEFLNLQFFVVASFHFFINLVYTHFCCSRFQVSCWLLCQYLIATFQFLTDF